MRAALEHRDQVDTAEARSVLGLDARELGALIGAVHDRAEVAAPDVAGALERGRVALELELARVLGRC